MNEQLVMSALGELVDLGYFDHLGLDQRVVEEMIADGLIACINEETATKIDGVFSTLELIVDPRRCVDGAYWCTKKGLLRLTAKMDVVKRRKYERYISNPYTAAQVGSDVLICSRGSEATIEEFLGGMLLYQPRLGTSGTYSIIESCRRMMPFCPEMFLFYDVSEISVKRYRAIG